MPHNPLQCDDRRESRTGSAVGGGGCEEAAVFILGLWGLLLRRTVPAICLALEIPLLWLWMTYVVVWLIQDTQTLSVKCPDTRNPRVYPP
jgi:hypothetical protein